MSASISILDHGRALTIDYAALLEYHGGGALAGAAIAFRAMQYAGEALSDARTWDRTDVAVVSWHGGPGVRDAIEFVTRAVTRNRFTLRQIGGAQECGTASAFRFEVSDRTRTVQLSLREGVVPYRFFALASISHRTAEEDAELDRLKSEIAAAVMQLRPQDLFEILAREPATQKLSAA